MKLQTPTIAEKILKDFCENYKNRHLEKLLSLCAEDINLWGTGVDEYRVGLKEVEEQVKRDWSQSEKAEIDILQLVSTPADALWAAALCQARIQVAGKEYCFPDFRGTIVIAKEKGEWKISHMHASFPDYRNAEKSSFPAF